MVLVITNNNRYHLRYYNTLLHLDRHCIIINNDLISYYEI